MTRCSKMAKHVEAAVAKNARNVTITNSNITVGAGSSDLTNQHHHGKNLEEFVKVVDEQNEVMWKISENVVEEDMDLEEPNIEVFPTMEILIKFYLGSIALKKIQYQKETPFKFCSSNPSKDQIGYEALKQLVLQKEGKRISIIGSAGSGKTIIISRLVRDLTRSEERPVLIVYLHFRNFSNNEEMTPYQFLFRGLFSKESDGSEGYKWLLNNQSKVVFLFDGLDQTSWQLEENANLVRPYEKGSISSIISNIFRKTLFPKVTVVYTSREHAVASLKRQLRPNKIIALTGFSQVNTERLLVSLIGNEGQKLWEKLITQSHSLIPILSTPAFLVFAAVVYKSNPDNLSSYVTGVMLTLLEIFKSSAQITGHITETDTPMVMKRLKKLAFVGLSNKQVLFLKRNVMDAGLKPEQLRDWLIKVPGKKKINKFLMEGEYAMFFSHQTIQETLGANFISESDPVDFKRIAETELKDDFWSVVTRFLSGILLNGDIADMCKQVADENLEPKKMILKQTLTSNYGAAQSVTQKLQVMACLSESNDVEFIRSLVTEVDISGFPIGASGVYLIASLIRNCSSLEKLNLGNCRLDVNTGGILWNSIRGSGVRIKHLDFTKNGISDEGLSVIGSVMQNSGDVIMPNCFVTLSGIEKLHDALMLNKLACLNLSGSDLSDARALAMIGHVLGDAATLIVDGCGITASGLESFESALGPKQLKRVDFSRNNLSDESTGYVIGSIVSSGCEIILVDCSVPALMLEKLKNALETERVQISLFDVSYNKITGAQCALVVGDIVKQFCVNKLGIRGCELTNDDMANLLDKAEGATLSYIYLDGNRLSRETTDKIKERINVDKIENY